MSPAAVLLQCRCAGLCSAGGSSLPMRNLIDELRRRDVLRIAAPYALVISCTSIVEHRGTTKNVRDDPEDI